MAEISAQMVKDLREKTGAGMMDCKKALTEAQGDFGKAEEWLRKKGISRAEAKGARVAAEGLIGLCAAGDGRKAAMVEVNCETDFVARNPEFQALTKNVAEHVMAQAPADLPALLEQAMGGKKVKEVLTDSVAKIGENQSIRRFVRFDAPAGGVIGAYMHSNQRIGAMVELSGSADAALARELAMQVAATSPAWVRREEIPADVLEKEKDIHRTQLREAKKPEAIWEKIITGKIEKYYETVCLVDQLWVKDDKKKIKDILQGATIARMARFQVGEGIEKKKDDLAAEVAKTLGETQKH